MEFLPYHYLLTTLVSFNDTPHSVTLATNFNTGLDRMAEIYVSIKHAFFRS